jgi:hypothetical protein
LFTDNNEFAVYAAFKLVQCAIPPTDFLIGD